MIVTMFSIVAIIIYTHTHARRYMPNRHYNIKGKSGTCLFVVRYTGHGADVHLCFLYFVACNQPKDLVVDAGESYKHNTLYGHRSPRWSHFFCFFFAVFIGWHNIPSSAASSCLSSCLSAFVLPRFLCVPFIHKRKKKGEGLKREKKCVDGSVRKNIQNHEKMKGKHWDRRCRTW